METVVLITLELLGLKAKAQLLGVNPRRSGYLRLPSSTKYFVVVPGWVGNWEKLSSLFRDFSSLFLDPRAHCFSREALIFNCANKEAETAQGP